eukprot:13903642-Heterocapsa_arctica.AAC.1
MGILLSTLQPLEDLWGQSEVHDRGGRLVQQHVPRARRSHHGMLSTPMREEHAAFEDLAEEGPANPVGDVPQVVNRSRNFLAQCRSLLEVPGCQPMQDVFFACEEPQEVE